MHPHEYHARRAAAGGASELAPACGSTPATAATMFDERDVFLTRREAAEYLRRSVVTMERWERLGIGPRSILCNGRRLYPLAGLREFTGPSAG